MNAFHRTWAEYAFDIIENGFKGGVGGIVQLSDRPLESEEIKGGSGGDVSLGVLVPEDILTQFEDKNTHYQRHKVRVFKVPADILNSCQVHLHETNYVGMTRAEVLRALENAKKNAQHIPGAPYPHPTVLEKALAFLEKYEGSTDLELRHRLIQQTAYYEWEQESIRQVARDSQDYWLSAVEKIDREIRALGGVPFF